MTTMVKTVMKTVTLIDGDEVSRNCDDPRTLSISSGIPGPRTDS